MTTLLMSITVSGMKRPIHDVAIGLKTCTWDLLLISDTFCVKTHHPVFTFQKQFLLLSCFSDECGFCGHQAACRYQHMSFCCDSSSGRSACGARGEPFGGHNPCPVHQCVPLRCVHAEDPQEGSDPRGARSSVGREALVAEDESSVLTQKRSSRTPQCRPDPPVQAEPGRPPPGAGPPSHSRPSQTQTQARPAPHSLLRFLRSPGARFFFSFLTLTRAVCIFTTGQVRSPCASASRFLQARPGRQGPSQGSRPGICRPRPHARCCPRGLVLHRHENSPNRKARRPRRNVTPGTAQPAGPPAAGSGTGLAGATGLRWARKVARGPLPGWRRPRRRGVPLPAGRGAGRLLPPGRARTAGAAAGRPPSPQASTRGRGPGPRRGGGRAEPRRPQQARGARPLPAAAPRRGASPGPRLRRRPLRAGRARRPHGPRAPRDSDGGAQVPARRSDPARRGHEGPGSARPPIGSGGVSRRRPAATGSERRRRAVPAPRGVWTLPLAVLPAPPPVVRATGRRRPRSRGVRRGGAGSAEGPGAGGHGARG